MPKRSTSYDLALEPRSPHVPAYQWLYQALRAGILKGDLPPRTRLPATRDLARQYGLSRGTIVNAFDQLCSEGYVEGKVGAGTYVSRVLPEALLHVTSERAEAATHRRRPCVLSPYAGQAETFTCYENRPTRAFRSNLPALDLFPTTLWARIAARCLRRMSTRNLMGCGPLGHEPLREAIADYLGRSRGVRCAPKQVAIVCGLQDALDLAARLLVKPGDRVSIENPGYPGAVLAFRAAGASVSAIGIDREGMVVGQLPPRGVRLVYITPGHQFPLGATMSLSRRLELLAWARKSGAMIFEDDYDGEYRYSARPIRALQGLDEHGTVLYAGSFSKVLFPSLRIGYLVVPVELLERVEAILSLTVRHRPLLEQLVLAEFITRGHFGSHLRHMREVYAGRLSVLLEESGARLRGLLELSDIEAGLQTVGRLCNGLSAKSASAAAAARGVDVTPVASIRGPLLSST